MSFSPFSSGPRRIAGVVLLLLLVAGLIAAKQMNKAAPEAEKPKAPAVLELAASDLITVQSGELRQVIALSGNLVPMRQTAIGSQFDGTMGEVLVRAGESVKAGQVLARFDDRDLLNQLATRSASLEKSRAELALAAKNLERSANLLKQNFISSNSYDATESSYAVAAAQVKSEAAQLEMAKKMVGDAVIRAPFAGVIAERMVEPGARMGGNQKLFSLVDLSTLEFDANVAAAKLPAIKAGQEVQLAVEGFGERRFIGHVERIAPVAQAGSRMIPIFVRVENEAGLLKGGMFVEGEVTVASVANARMVPLSALRGTDSDSPYLLTVENGKIVERKVKVGLINELGKMAAISDGVDAGQTVVIAKLATLKSGQQVKLPGQTALPAASTGKSDQSETAKAS